MQENTAWNAPIPLRAGQPALKDFPVHALPPIVRPMCQAVSISTSTDPAMAATAILSSISYCFSGLYRIMGKPDHTEPLVLDTLTVAEPSSKKSPVIALVKEPYVTFTANWNEQHRSEILKKQAERELAEQQLASLRKSKDASAEDLAALQAKIGDMRGGGFCRIVVDDITPESLVRELEQNGTLLMMSDEAGMLGNFSGRYSNNIPNLDLLLKSWNGETFISDRATRDSIVLRKPYVSICLACQPYLFEDMMRNAAFRGSGLIARLVYCFPVSFIGSRRYDTQPVDEGVLAKYRGLIFQFLNWKFNHGDTDEQMIRLDEKAYQMYVDYYNNRIEKALIGDMVSCKDWGGKYHGLVLRIAGILHCINSVMFNGEPTVFPVNQNLMSRAIEIADYYRQQAIFAYSIGDADPAVIKAERVLERIRAKHVHSLRQSELYRHCRCGLFHDAHDFAQTLDLLEEYGYIRREDIAGANGNNKGGIMVHINPRLYI